MKSLATISIILFLAASAVAQEKCTLETYASSWMKTGTAFYVDCPSGRLSGTLVTSPARRFFRRGTLRLKFDSPAVAVTRNREGVMRPSRGKQISSMLLAGGAGIGSKDATDGLTGAVFKSWYAIPITFGALAFFEKGGDVNLQPGFQITVEIGR